MNSELEAMQVKICEKHGVPYCPSLPNLKAGIALNVRTSEVPINGLRHPPQGDATGWFIWAGEEMSDDPDFFKPLHIEHLQEWCPGVQKYLGLPPGWRFLVVGEYEDVWYDESLINV